MIRQGTKKGIVYKGDFSPCTLAFKDKIIDTYEVNELNGNGVIESEYKPLKEVEVRGNSVQEHHSHIVHEVEGYSEIVESINLAKSFYSNEITTNYNGVLFVDFDLKPNTTYTLYCKCVSGVNLYFNENISNVRIANITTNGNTQTITFTTKEEISSNQFINNRGWLLLKNASGNTIAPSFSEVMVVNGSDTTIPYTPYFAPYIKNGGVFSDTDNKYHIIASDNTDIAINEPLREGDILNTMLGVKRKRKAFIFSTTDAWKKSGLSQNNSFYYSALIPNFGGVFSGTSKVTNDNTISSGYLIDIPEIILSSTYTITLTNTANVFSLCRRLPAETDEYQGDTIQFRYGVGKSSSLNATGVANYFAGHTIEYDLLEEEWEYFDQPYECNENATFTDFNKELEATHSTITSPTPQYPEEIKSVSGTLKKFGENLCPRTDIVTDTNNGFFNTTQGLFGYVEANKTYTFSFKINAESVNKNIGIRLLNSDNNQKLQDLANINITQNNVTISVTFTPTQSGYIGFTAGGWSNTKLSHFMLVEGSEQVNYEPFVDIANINLLELHKIGNAQDKIIVKDNKVMLHRETEKLVLNGSENWTTTSNSSVGTLYELSIVKIAKDNAISNMYKENEFRVQNGTLSIHDDTIGNVNNLKAKLQSNNLIVVYELETPTDTDISNTELGQELLTLNLTPFAQNHFELIADVEGELIVKFFKHKGD